MNPVILEDARLLVTCSHPSHIERLCSWGLAHLPRFHRGHAESSMMLGFTHQQ